MLKSILLKVVSYKAKIQKYAIVALIIAGVFFAGKLAWNEYSSMKRKLARSEANITAYQDQLIATVNDKAVLELTAASLEHFNDSIVQEMVKTKKRLKIALNKAGDIAAHSQTVIYVTDTIKMMLPMECVFDTVIKKDSLTKFSIKYANNELIHQAEINNTQDLFVYSTREYVNEYKNKCKRLLAFDWKKRDIVRYTIQNSNNNIHTINTRVFKVN